MSRAVIIHHASCFDGVAAAWVVNKYLTTRTAHEGEIVLHPATYGSKPPDVRGAIVFMVDFSYPREVLLQMAKDAEFIHVLDHHKTAQADLADLPFCDFDMNKSGAGMAWDAYFTDVERPWLINAVEDRDLWRFKLPGTKLIIAYLAARPLTIDLFEETSKVNVNVVMERGLAIQDYIDTFGEKVCDQWTMRRILTYNVPVINTPYMNCSDHIERLSQKLPGHPFYASFFMVAGGRWQFSLRSKGDFDVSKIAEVFGGGGHKPAAGFTTDVLPWE